MMEEICKCGHSKLMHTNGKGRCCTEISGGGIYSGVMCSMMCDCKRFKGKDKVK